MPKMASSPLAGLRVIEVGQYIAAPFAATLFADQGADVSPALQGQREALEPLGAVDRVEHPRPADILRAALRLQVTVNAN